MPRKSLCMRSSALGNPAGPLDLPFLWDLAGLFVADAVGVELEEEASLGVRVGGLAGGGAREEAEGVPVVEVVGATGTGE